MVQTISQDDKPGLAGGKVRSDNLRPARVDPDRPFPTARGILSAAEIEALLRPDLPEPAPKPAQTTKRDIPDLNAPRAALDEEDGDRLCARLALSVKRSTGLSLALQRLETRTGPFRAGLPAPEAGAAHACFGTPDGQVTAILTLSGAATAALIEMSCGAAADTLATSAPRPLTEIDTAVLQRALEPMAAHLPGGVLHCIETRPAFTHSIAPPGPASCLHLQAVIENITAGLRLILSDAAIKAAPQDAGVESAAPAGGTSPAGLTALLTARIASLSVPVSRLSDLKPGDTLLLGVPADEPVQLLSGGRTGPVVAEGEIGRKGKRMAVRISRRGGILLQRA